MQRRFMLVYRHFRHKKYGEPIPKQNNDLDDSEELEDMFKEDLALQNKIQ